MLLSFDPIAHRYAVDGRGVLSVTSRIAAAGLLGSAAAFYDQTSAERGTRVHAACLALDLNQPVTLLDDERGYLDSYAAWRSLIVPTWTRLETPCYSATYDTAGTADRLGTIAERPVVLDLKTGHTAGWHGIQLAMYDLIHDDVPPRQRRRIALYLRPDGRTAQSVEYHAPADYQIALALLKGTHGSHCSDRDDPCLAQCDGESHPESRTP